MKRIEPMTSLAHVMRQLGEDRVQELIARGVLHPMTDERGVRRVPIDEVAPYLPRPGGSRD
jgi:hypothetical protein